MNLGWSTSQPTMTHFGSSRYGYFGPIFWASGRQSVKKASFSQFWSKSLQKCRQDVSVSPAILISTRKAGGKEIHPPNSEKIALLATQIYFCDAIRNWNFLIRVIRRCWKRWYHFPEPGETFYQLKYINFPTIGLKLHQRVATTLGLHFLKKSKTCW